MSTAFHLTPLPRGSTLRSDTTASLVRAVLKGELKQGDKLVVRKLADQLGVSATPVRESIVELEAIGIVEVPPNQSAIIRPFGPQELFEIYHLRGLLEIEATRLATPRIPNAKLVQMRDLVSKLLHDSDNGGRQWSARAVDHDRELHQIIANYCGSGRLFHEINRYGRLMAIIGDLLSNDHASLLTAMQEHLVILEAMLVPDADLAGKRMASHIHNAALRDIRGVYGKAAQIALNSTFGDGASKPDRVS